jgi:hypothetical protein
VRSVKRSFTEIRRLSVVKGVESERRVDGPTLPGKKLLAKSTGPVLAESGPS